MNDDITLPKYKPNWHIWAAKISSITPGIHGSVIHSEDSDHDFFVNDNYMNSFFPEVGGYYIVMSAGFESYQSAEEMKGYALVEGGQS